MIISYNILQLIPQRYPFVMVDDLVYADEKKACTTFTITADNIFCENGFFNEAGLMENIAQTAAAGAGYRAKLNNQLVENGFIGAVKNFEVFFLPCENDKLSTEVYMQENIFNMTSITGKILCNNLLIAQCEMKVFSNAGV